MNKKYITISKFIFKIIIFILLFWAGMWWQSFLYDDSCLDMGGGKNPGNYSICVIEIEKK